ncbi:uncharacterized protein LOC134215794 [Armigeres subalbatus]|uniref:uncharacterized protein LOC134215794 n=1 Tax=Armigeres subalbatus TaxID=124917 RepID=UPI002ED2F8C9
MEVLNFDHPKMEQPNIVLSQCRFCLNVTAQNNLFPNFDDRKNKSLYAFVQRVLSQETMAGPHHVCCDCISMWHMIQEYVQACVSAHQILQVGTSMTLRKSWLRNQNENRMLDLVYERVRKLNEEMEVLRKTVTRAPRVYGKKPANTVLTVHGMQQEMVQRKGSRQQQVVNNIKQEDEVEIDDSDAFHSNDPIEARRKDQADPLAVEVELHNLAPRATGEPVEDAVTIIEPKIDQVDLVDSSSEEEDDDDDEDEEEFESEEDCYPSGEKMKFDEYVLKTVCQLCGTRTRDMANHLEIHIKDPPSIAKTAMESDSSTSSNGLKRRKRPRKPFVVQKPPEPPPLQVNSLKCQFCGIEFTSMLAAKLHARSHGANW